MDIAPVTPRIPAVEPVNALETRYQRRTTLDEKTGEPVAREVDRLTGEVTRQIPAEEELKLQAAIRALLGNAFDRLDRQA